jgi:hypothetical protein
MGVIKRELSMKKVRKFVLSKREKVLWLKVHAINPDTMHKDGPTSWELAAIIHEASRKDYQYKFSEEMMSDLIVGSYKNNLNISPHKKLDKKEGLEDFIIASLEFLKVYKSSTTHENFINLIRKLTHIYKDDVKK